MSVRGARTEGEEQRGVCVVRVRVCARGGGFHVRVVLVALG